MELIERSGFLNMLLAEFHHVLKGEGHCIFVSGEAGIGKTSLIKSFCNETGSRCNIYQGTCDALFTPRPLAPLYDILLQIRNAPVEHNIEMEDRSAFFAGFFHELKNQKEVSLIVFEDIHWADEATLDFIKFLARRITRLRCLFILTYRDDEIHSRHPLRNVLGQLNPGSFTRIQLLPFSREAVEVLARQRGYNGEDVYSISGGNPFYVNEILASYSPGVPENIRDSILSVFNRQDEKTRHLWEILSVLPTGLEIKFLDKMESFYTAVIEQSLDTKILILKEGLLSFKHELYRRTIETSLSPLKRVALNKKILSLFLESFELNNKTEQIIHHAKNANDYELVTKYAPLAAGHAASVGAHIEAARLYLSAIEYYQGNDKDILNRFYESYAYECYLINQHREAIIFMGKSLELRKKENNLEKMGNCMRFLSRLWWLDGNQKQAESFGWQAIAVLDNQPPSKAKAMAYSNMSQLKMKSEQTEECISWGEKAIAVAHEVNDEETIAHALNSMGTSLMLFPSSYAKGTGLLQQSLAIALKNSFHEHVAQAYGSLGNNGVTLKDYAFAKINLDKGIQYCEERDLDSQKFYLLSWKARLNLETGLWKEAYDIAGTLLKIENLSPPTKIGALVVLATIKMRRGDPDALSVLMEAKSLSFETTELYRIIPTFLALLEYEWLTGKSVIEEEVLSQRINRMVELGKFSRVSRLYFWLGKAEKQHLLPEKNYKDLKGDNKTLAAEEVRFWEKTGSPYEHALVLFEGPEEQKRQAISVIHGLGGQAVYDKLKSDMRSSGIKSIPRGIRKTTQSNTALLTERELEVLQVLKEGLQNKEIGARLFISAKTVDHHISSIMFKLEVNTRAKAVQEAKRLAILK